MEPQMNKDEHRFKISDLKLICVHLCSPVVILLFSAGCQTEFGRHLSGYFSGNTPLKAAQKIEDHYAPDERRDGINRLSDRDFGRRQPYTTRYQQLAQLDSDWLVRATAIRALNRSRDATATPIFIKALADENEVVRVEAAKALSNLPDEKAAPALVAIVTNAGETRDVRICAADALRHYHNLQVARALAAQLSIREFGLAWQARRSLVTLTGQDLRYDEAAWLQYLTGPEKPFG
jgi:hypothetical protein